MQWIDEHVGDRPYSDDVVIPGKYEGMGELDPGKLAEQLRAMVPQEHLAFAKSVLSEHGVPEFPPEESNSLRLLGWTAAAASPHVGVALNHDKMRLIANALGSPPAEIIDEIHASGRLVATLCGSPDQARRHK